MRKFRSLKGRIGKNSEIFTDLIYGWGNEGWSALGEYLHACIDQTRESNGPILECGSGLSTILLGIICQETDNRLWTLEHDQKWADKVKSILEKHKIDSVHLCVAPLINYGDFSWYTPPTDSMPKNFSLVICDGPPGDTPGGRYGLLPVMKDHFTQSCVILLDDGARQDEKSIAERWSSTENGSFVIRGTEKPYIEISLQFGNT